MYALEPSTRLTSVFETLRREIVAGELRPNSPLIELDLAERFEVSRTPVRESLQRLATAWSSPANVVGRSANSRPRRSARILKFGWLSKVTGLAATRASAAQIAELKAIHDRRLALRSSDEEMRVRTNSEFHDAIMAASGNERLTNAIYHSGQFYFNAPIARAATGDELALGNADHELILSAIAQRNAEAAERAMRAHIKRTFAVFWRLTGKDEAGPPDIT
jgi:DNA-binding GntR family transcriptional regulator